MMLSGVLNVYKEAGFTSHDVVAKMRGILQIKKIGHTGTLDPDAVGVLPVCVGNATKLCDMLGDETKEYVALLKLGISTDTQDMSGNVLKDATGRVSLLQDKDIENAIMSFKGEYDQIPPMYSALKVNGQKLYDLARKGIEVERKSRRVTISELEIVKGEDNDLFTDRDNNLIKIRVVCSKGTYIRTLCNDIGEKLGVGGAMEHLTRTRVGNFKIEDALKLEEIEKLVKIPGEDKLRNYDSLHNIIIPVDRVFSDYPALHIAESGMKALINGNQLQPETLVEVNDNAEFMLTARRVYRIYSYDNQFYGLYEYHSGWKVLKSVKMFLPEKS